MVDQIKDISEQNQLVLIPSSIFKDRKLSVLESLVEYMHDKENLAFKDIAKLLNRDGRTVWTVYDRLKKKRR